MSAEETKDSPTLDEMWRKHAPRWQAKLDRDDPLSPPEERNLNTALEAWTDDGCATAKTWTPDQIADFKRRWEQQMAGWQGKERRGAAFTLEEQKEIAHGLGVWWRIGYRESAEWDDKAWERFKADCAAYSEADKQRLEEGRGRTLRDRQGEEHRQGVWQRHAKLMKAEYSDLEAWAAERVKPWTGIQADDVDFSDWIPKRADEGSNEARNQRELIQAGTYYEYARESRKLRGLLLVCNRIHADTVRSIRRFKRRRNPKRLDTPPSVGVSDHRHKFEDLQEKDANAVLRDWLYFLEQFAHELADNIPFSRVWKEHRDRVEKALWREVRDKKGRTVKVCKVKDYWGYFMPAVPVTPAFSGEKLTATDYETLTGPSRKAGKRKVRKRKRAIRRTGIEIITVRVDWHNFTNKEIGEAFERFAIQHRPKERKQCEEPNRQKASKAQDLRAPMTWLAAMRNLACEATLGKKLDKSGKNKMIVTLAGKAVREDNYRTLGRMGRDYLNRLFPFGDAPTNYWA